MIREFRSRYPKALAFLQAECDMAARDGDFTRAMALTHEIDELANTSTLGPALPSPALQLAEYASRGRRGLYRGPRSRSASPAASSNSGSCSGRPSSRTTSPRRRPPGHPRVGQREEPARCPVALGPRHDRVRRDLQRERVPAREAIARLEQVIKDNPTFAEAYQTLAEIYLKPKRGGDGDRRFRRGIAPPRSPC